MTAARAQVKAQAKKTAAEKAAKAEQSAVKAATDRSQCPNQSQGDDDGGRGVAAIFSTDRGINCFNRFNGVAPGRPPWVQAQARAGHGAGAGSARRAVPPAPYQQVYIYVCSLLLNITMFNQ